MHTRDTVDLVSNLVLFGSPNVYPPKKTSSQQNIMSQTKHLSRRTALKSLAALAIAAIPAPFLAPSIAHAADKIRVLAASYPALLAARTALEGLDSFECSLLTDAQMGCPHDYAMTPQERMKLESADVLILSGKGYEAFLDARLLAGLKGLVIDAGKNVPPLEKGKALSSHNHAHAHGDTNPHHFANPACFALMVETIAKGLSERFPEASQKLAANAKAFGEKASLLENELASLSRDRGEDTHLVLQHDTLSWFFAGTSFPVDAILQEGDAQSPSAALLLSLAQTMKKSGKSHLLVGDKQFSTDVLDLLARESGGTIVLLDTLVSGPADAGASHYLATMEANVAALHKALGK